MKLVLDTNVIVSGLLWSGAPNRLIGALVASQNEIVISDAILAELADVLSRHKLRPRIEAMNMSVDGLLAEARLLGRWVKPEPIRRVAPDPDDDLVIATALAGNAELIVTGDRPFLSLRHVEQLAIVSVRQAMTILFPAG